jgi:hypothetical protein
MFPNLRLALAGLRLDRRVAQHDRVEKSESIITKKPLPAMRFAA